MAQPIIPYLNFDGNCREAMEFYQSCLGGELQITPFESSPMEVPEAYKDRVLHAVLQSDNLVLMACDTLEAMPLMYGNQVQLSISCESQSEIEYLFSAFSDGARVNMPLQDTFWGATFGMLTDRYGIHWMFNFDKPEA